MDLSKVDDLVSQYRGNWQMDADVETEFRDLWRVNDYHLCDKALRKILDERLAAGKVGKWDGPRPNEFRAVMNKLFPRRSSSSGKAPATCEHCNNGWRLVVFCGPNWNAHPAELVKPAELTPDTPLAKFYWSRRIPCRCPGGEYRRVKYTALTELQANRLYAASMSLCQGAWLCEDLQLYANNRFYGAPLPEKSEPIPEVAKIIANVSDGILSHQDRKSEERITGQADPVEESWENAEETWK